MSEDDNNACPYTEDGNHNWRKTGEAADGTMFYICTECGREYES